MFSSRICSSGFGLSIPTNEDSLKNSFPGGGGDISKGREISGTDFFPNQNQSHGLARHRKAPTSFLAALLDSNTDGNGSSGDESEAFFSALIDGPRDLDQKNGENHHHHHQVLYTLMQEIGAETETRPESFTHGHTGGYVGSHSPGMENQVHVSLCNNGNTSNLGRQSSSPAGFLNGFSVMGGKENYILQNHAETCGSSAAGFSNRYLNFSAGPPSGPRFMLAIPENPNESIATCLPENGQSRDSNSSRNELPSKRNRDGELKMFYDFNGLENQNGESSKKSKTGLISRMSLPKTISETADDNYLHFREETSDVPFQIRARRGCATHPRSIAERIRRNRISDNMKKLQDVFPNMDKQINTADMLDSVVEYIKDLQKQVQILTDKKAKCVCEEISLRLVNEKMDQS